MSKGRVPMGHRMTSLASDKGNRTKYRYLEFKYLYFQIQKLINKKVMLSLKYEQLKTPEIRTALIKPLVTKLVDMSRLSSLHAVFNSQVSSGQYDIYDTPHFTTVNYGSVLLDKGAQQSADSLSTNLIYVLLLLRMNNPRPLSGPLGQARQREPLTIMRNGPFFTSFLARFWSLW